MNVSKLAPYTKAVVAVCGFLVLLAKAVSDGTLTAVEVQDLVLAAATALGVYHLPNRKG